MTGDSPATSRPWTPGPWTGLYAEHDGTITLGHGGTESSLTWEDQRLAVAAPDLYEALEELVREAEDAHYNLEYEYGGTPPDQRDPLLDAIVAARSALRRARGE